VRARPCSPCHSGDSSVANRGAVIVLERFTTLSACPTPAMTTAPTDHGDFHYEIAVLTRADTERVHPYASDDPLSVGSVVRLEGRYWLIETMEAAAEESPARAVARPARYRLRLLHPDGREEAGAFRRFRPGAPRLGHAFTTVEDGQPVGWQVVEERLARDEQGEPYLDLLAERDYSEFEAVPDHELEHALAVDEEEGLPPAAVATFSRAEEAGLAVELVALEPGEEPDWDEAERFIDALILEEIEDDLLELCGVRPGSDPRDGWLATVKERLSSDLAQFRADLEGERDHIEQWSFRDGLVLASVGTMDEEADPDSGHGWMCRLADSGALAAAGFARVRKAEL
jgi:hypothetical protein